MKNILEMLELSVEKFPEKEIFCDADNNFRYTGFLEISKNIGSYIAKTNMRKKPIAIII